MVILREILPIIPKCKCSALELVHPSSWEKKLPLALTWRHVVDVSGAGGCVPSVKPYTPGLKRNPWNPTNNSNLLRKMEL